MLEKKASALLILTIVLPQNVGVPLPFLLPSLDLPRMAILALHLTFALYVWRNRSATIKDMVATPETSRYLSCLGLLIAMSVFASLLSPSPGSSSLLWSLYYYLFGPGLAFALFVMLGRSHLKNMLSATLMIVCLYLSTVAIVEYLVGHDLFDFRNTGYLPGVKMFTHLTRVGKMTHGPFISNHSLAVILLMFGGFCMVPVHFRNNLVRGIVLLIWFAAVLSTQSLAALIALAAMISMYLFVKRDIDTMLISIAVSIICVTVILWLDDQQYWFHHYANYATAGASNSGSLSGRVENYFEAIRLILERPFGYGSGAFFDPDRVVVDRLQIGEDRWRDAGIFTAIAIETGLAAVLVLLVMLGTAVKRIWIRDDRALGIILGLVGFAVFSLSSRAIVGLPYALFLCGLAISWSIGRQGDRAGPQH
jgi:hypothetical protein